jgi:hypothetical protein
MVGPLDLSTDLFDRFAKGAQPGWGKAHVCGSPVPPAGPRDQTHVDEFCQKRARRGLIHLQLFANVGEWNAPAAIGGECE